MIPVDIVEGLMGHEGYLTEVYRRYSEEDLAKFYLRGEPSILIFAETGDVAKLRKEKKRLRSKTDSFKPSLTD